MTIQTKYLGDMKVSVEKIINFAHGLPGFNSEKKFTLMDLPDNPVFKILQSVYTPELAFIVTDPYRFYQNYAFKLDASILDALQISNPKNVLVLTIVTLTQPFEQSTLNLKAPIIINATTKKGKQYILNDNLYQTKTSIIPPKANQVKGE